MTRSAWWLTSCAATLGAATAFGIAVTATEVTTAVTPLVVAGVILLVGFLLIGTSRWMGLASAPMVGAIVLEAGFADEPSWVRSILLGCVWYLTMECAWEAVDRRDGARHTRAANQRRLQEVVAVAVCALGLGAAAAVATTAAPLRSVLLQALAVSALLAVFVGLLRSGART